MRIAHINVAKGYRGGERQTELLIRALNEHDVPQVLVAREGGLLARRLADARVEVRPVSGNPLSVAFATRGVDLLHVHEGRSVYGAYLRSLLSRTPYVVTRRVNNPLGDHWLCHKAYRRAAFVASVAAQVAEVVKRFDPQIESRVVHSSSSGLSVDAATSAAIRARYPGKVLVGNVGALDKRQKGQDFIIEVAKDLARTHPTLQFLLVGDGPDEELLKDAAAGLPNVAFVGFVDNVGDYMAAFDMFILPSRKEGIGGILLDAMEQRLPVVASRVGGLPEIVHDGENGLLIDPDPGQLKAAILRLHDAPELGRQLGENGRRLATGFTASVMCEKYLELYRSALAGRRGA